MQSSAVVGGDVVVDNGRWSGNAHKFSQCRENMLLLLPSTEKFGPKSVGEMGQSSPFNGSCWRRTAKTSWWLLSLFSKRRGKVRPLQASYRETVVRRDREEIEMLAKTVGLLAAKTRRKSPRRISSGQNVERPERKSSTGW